MSTYNEYSLKDLKELAKELKIVGIHKLDKESLIKKIEEAQGIKSKPTEKSSAIETDDELEKNINDYLKNEEEQKSVETPIEIIESSVKEENPDKPAGGIDLSSEEEILDTNSLFKDLGALKPVEDKPTDTTQLVIENSVPELKPEVNEADIIKPAYQGNMLTGIILSSIPKTIYFEVLKENNLNEDELKNLLSKELQAGEPYSEERKDIFVKDFIDNFKDEITRLLKIRLVQKVDITLQHKHWQDYLKMYKQTPADILKRYPNHRQKQIFEDLIRHQEQQDKK